ncbi:hypothetical protein ACLKA6_020053 [Drosophila palustris]
MRAPTSTAECTGSLRILMGHGADHGYHRETKVPERVNAGITVRTVGIANDGRCCGNKGSLRILMGHGTDHGYHRETKVPKRENAGITVRTVGITNVGAAGTRVQTTISLRSRCKP